MKQYHNHAPIPGDPASSMLLLRDRAIVSTLYATGMRRAELAALDRGHLEGTETTILGKGGRERTMYFDGECRAQLGAYLLARTDSAAPLFIRHDDARGEPGPSGERWRLSPQSIWGVVTSRAREFGLVVRPHDFRHLKARVMINSGVRAEAVQACLGHASLATTLEIYAPYTAAYLKDVWLRHSRPARDVAGDPAIPWP